MEKQVYEYVYTQTGENIIEWKRCSCGEEFPITDKDMEFYEKISSVFNGQKYLIPSPSKCPDCRQQRRLARRNERKLYKRKCDLTGKSIIAMFPEDSKYKVYDQKEWWSDNWDPMDYGREFDFSKTFFEQFDELMNKIPHSSLYNTNCENSDYGNLNTDLKNCYLCFATGYSESSLYLKTSARCKNTLDSYWALNTENSYEIIDVNHCYGSFNILESENIENSKYLINCKYLSDSIMSVNINGGKCYFLNEIYSEKQFSEIKEKLEKDKNYFHENLKKFVLLCNQFPKSNRIINSINSNGWYIKNSSNCTYCFDTIDSENCKYCAYIGLNAKNCYDCGGDMFQVELGYESSITPFGYKNMFSYNCWNGNNLNYSINNYYSSYLFGCIGLRNKSYCILNKHYTKEEYEVLVPKIIEHMKKTGERGEFFPASISPFGYNETVANEYFPLERDEALKQGFKRQDKEYPINVPDGIELVKAQDLPDNIKDIDDEILKKAIVCEVSGKPFRIVKPELEFYRKHILPLPRKHPDIRHLERLAKRAPRKLYLRTCDNCGKDIISVYPQESEYKVYCEECYNKEIY